MGTEPVRLIRVLRTLLLVGAAVLMLVSISVGLRVTIHTHEDAAGGTAQKAKSP